MKRGWGVLLVVLVFAGCGGDEDDDDAGTTSAPPSSSTASSPTALPVPAPRDASRLITDPCSAFTAEQLAGFGVTVAGELTPKPSPGSPEKCAWDALSLMSTSPSIDLLVRQFGRPEDATGLLDTGIDRRVERIEIAGNPAAVRQVFVGDTRCEAVVLAEARSVVVLGLDRNGETPPDPCVPARVMAQTAVENLEPLR